MNTFTASLIAFAGLAAQAEAFWGTAHLLIARRAQAILEDQYPDVLDAALNELKPIQEYYPELVEEGDHPFTECATFADNIKSKGYSFQSDWHFINIPYLDEEGTKLDDFDFTIPDVDVVRALDAFTKFLKGEISASESTYTSQVADHFSYEEDQRSFALRMIVHYVGDVHQPLHSTALVDSHYPTGDRGGNSEKIPSVDGVSNLHSVWDSVLYSYTGYPDTPLNSSDWDWYTSEAETLATTYPIDQDMIWNGEFSEWAMEGFDMAKEDVYPDFVEGQDPDQAYIDFAKPLVLKHMMYGGARLAALMVDIYGNNTAVPQTFLN